MGRTVNTPSQVNQVQGTEPRVDDSSSSVSMRRSSTDNVTGRTGGGSDTSHEISGLTTHTEQIIPIITCHSTSRLTESGHEMQLLTNVAPTVRPTPAVTVTPAPTVAPTAPFI